MRDVNEENNTQDLGRPLPQYFHNSRLIFYILFGFAVLSLERGGTERSDYYIIGGLLGILLCNIGRKICLKLDKIIDKD